jgi:hypothetical protein
MILGRVFGYKRDKNGEWRRLHNEELHSLYLSLNIIHQIEMGMACSQNGIKQECHYLNNS